MCHDTIQAKSRKVTFIKRLYIPNVWLTKRVIRGEQKQKGNLLPCCLLQKPEVENAIIAELAANCLMSALF
jgi:hypothetical protein